MPDEDVDRHPAATGTTTSGSPFSITYFRGLWLTIIIVILFATTATTVASEASPSAAIKGSHHRQRTDYGMENPDFRSSSAVVARVNDTTTTTTTTTGDNRKYPQPLLPQSRKDTVYKAKNKRRRGRPDMAPEVDFPRPYHRSRSSPSSSSAAALFLQASKDSMRGDKMLKSSKDALIVTKKSYLKKDWCKTEPLIQRVREVGCITRTVVNRFCYGQCNSFYIPKSAVPAGGGGGSSTSSDLDQTSFKSCAFCKPKRFSWITITLKCPGRKPPYKKKRIQRIKKCKCISEIL